MSFQNPDIFSHPEFSHHEPEPEPLRINDHELHQFLLTINYYRKLSMTGQSVFRGRIRQFVSKKIIIGVNHVKLPDIARAFIAASAVQLTFGLREWTLNHFHTIRIYPKEFYSRINEKYLKGGAGQNGVIWFSWKDYLAGYANQENGINLGLHEMGHALMIDMQNGGQSEEFNTAYERLVETERDLLPMVRSGSVAFLRKYAGTNISEFFAVSIEHFFEQPMEFKKMQPVLYTALCDLLQQDPAAGSHGTEPVELMGNDPQPLVFESPDEIQKPKKNFRFARWHWSLSVLLTGIFISPVPLIFLCQVTLISGSVIFLIYLLLIAAGAFYFYPRIVQTQALDKNQFSLFILFGWGPVSLLLLLALNLLPVNKEKEEYYLTGRLNYVSGEIVPQLVGNHYLDEPEVLGIGSAELSKIHAGGKMVLHFNRGLLGIRVHDYNEILP